jgi:nucleotide-binding universal stress UspA family protein
MQRKFKKILLVIRGRKEEKAVIQRAARLAKQSGAKLTALRVLQRQLPDAHMESALVPQREIEKIAAALAHEDLRKALRPVEKQSAAQVKVTWGTPFLEVIREVQRHRFDLVMVNARAVGTLRGSLFGHMTMRLMRKCPCPVWAVKTGTRAPANRVLAAIAAPESAEAAKLNDKIVELASSVAQQENSELHLVHAWDVFAEGILRGRAGVKDADLDAMTRQARLAGKKVLLDLVSRHGLSIPPERIHLVKGSAAAVIPRLVLRKKIDVLVMGTVCRTGVAGFLMGNTAERVLGNVKCSVLTLKPDGFVTPVRLK